MSKVLTIIVTSPPYFNILKHNSKGLRADKSLRDLEMAQEMA